MLRNFINHVENIFIQLMPINNRWESINDSNNKVKVIFSSYFMFSRFNRLRRLWKLLNVSRAVLLSPKSLRVIVGNFK